jgi:hypothetical protein
VLTSECLFIASMLMKLVAYLHVDYDYDADPFNNPAQVASFDLDTDSGILYKTLN